jgi:cell division protease FtsH
MVTKWGLSEKLGPMRYEEENDEPFLGRSASSASTVFSDQTAKLIDEESKKIIDTCYKIATDLLNKNIDKLHAMAKALVEYETLNTDQIDDIMAGAKPRSGKSDDSGAKPKRKKSNPSISDPANQT